MLIIDTDLNMIKETDEEKQNFNIKSSFMNTYIILHGYIYMIGILHFLTDMFFDQYS